MPRRLPNKVKIALHKALDSALLAVEVYNKPSVKFKTGGYVVLMVVAWTALFHAIFFYKKIKPFYKEKGSRFYKKVDGDNWYWELDRCLSEYFGSDTNNPIRLNLELFIKLRNKIEHKSLPKIDPDIFAECQAMLLNFDFIVKKEFGDSYCIREMLSFALQLSPSSDSLKKAALSTEESNVIDFINSYRSSISIDVLKSGQYSFKAFLIQVANHNTIDALPIQFIQYDKLTDDEKKNVERVAALIKTKLEKVPVRNHNLMLPKYVIPKVQSKLGNPKIRTQQKTEIDLFNNSTHTRCWQKYKVSPVNNSSSPEKTDSRYCIFDTTFEQYMYTEDWINFLVEKLSSIKEYHSLFKSNPEIVKLGIMK